MSYVAITAPLGCVEPQKGIWIAAGEARRYRAEHLARLRSNSAALDDAIEAGRIVVRRVALAGDEAEACDVAWRSVCRPYTFASSARGDDVRDPDKGLGSSTIGGAR